MKVLQLGKFYPIRGGVEKVMWEFVTGLGEQGTDCDMLCAILPADAEKEGLKFERDIAIIPLNTHSRCICARAFAKKSATMLSFSMVAYLRKHKDEYDIIHVHHPDPMAALALWTSGYAGKVVLHWHSDILKQRVLLKFFKPLQNWLTRRADSIVGTTPVYVAQSPHLQAVQAKCDYLPIGVEKLQVNEQNLLYLRNEFIGKKLIFSLGRLVEYKGFTYLIEAAGLLPEDYVVVIGGTGPLKGQLQQQIDSCGLNGRVHLAGYLSDDDAHAYMAACDIFVLSSVMKTEAFGIVQIEVMSCGKPVVATTIPGSGTSWVNGDGVSGLNVAPRDAGAIASAVRKIVEGGRYDEFCKGARERFDSFFTRQRMIENLIIKYKTIL